MDLNNKLIVVVAGLPRSGTSLTMQMLHAGGLPCIGTPPDFEEFPVGQIDWGKCFGKVVKLLDPEMQNINLDVPGPLVILRTTRDFDQMAKSSAQFLRQMVGIKDNIDVNAMKTGLKKSSRLISKWAEKHAHGFLNLGFEETIGDPYVQANAIGRFLKKSGAISVMDFNYSAAADVVFERTTGCHDGMLEPKILEKYGSDNDE